MEDFAAGRWPGRVNVGRNERIASTAAGAALVAWGATRRSLPGVLTALSGATLLFRGTTGFCPVYAAAGMSTAPGSGEGGDDADGVGGERPSFSRSPATASPHRGAARIDDADEDEGVAFGDDPGAVPPGAAPDYDDEVDEASEESFPASDPPSFTPDSHIGGPGH